jgi:hypothetical protein
MSEVPAMPGLRRGKILDVHVGVNGDIVIELTGTEGRRNIIAANDAIVLTDHCPCILRHDGASCQLVAEYRRRKIFVDGKVVGSETEGVVTVRDGEETFRKSSRRHGERRMIIYAGAPRTVGSARAEEGAEDMAHASICIKNIKLECMRKAVGIDRTEQFAACFYGETSVITAEILPGVVRVERMDMNALNLTKRYSVPLISSLSSALFRSSSRDNTGVRIACNTDVVVVCSGSRGYVWGLSPAEGTTLFTMTLAVNIPTWEGPPLGVVVPQGDNAYVYTGKSMACIKTCTGFCASDRVRWAFHADNIVSPSLLAAHKKVDMAIRKMTVSQGICYVQQHVTVTPHRLPELPASLDPKIKRPVIPETFDMCTWRILRADARRHQKRCIAISCKRKYPPFVSRFAVLKAPLAYTAVCNEGETLNTVVVTLRSCVTGEKQACSVPGTTAEHNDFYLITYVDTDDSHYVYFLQEGFPIPRCKITRDIVDGNPMFIYTRSPRGCMCFFQAPSSEDYTLYVRFFKLD